MCFLTPAAGQQVLIFEISRRVGPKSGISRSINRFFTCQIAGTCCRGSRCCTLSRLSRSEFDISRSLPTRWHLLPRQQVFYSFQAIQARVAAGVPYQLDGIEQCKRVEQLLAWQQVLAIQQVKNLLIQHLLPRHKVPAIQQVKLDEIEQCTRVEHLLQRHKVPAIQQVKNLSMDLEMPGFWPSQPGDFKNQHLLPWQQVSKNHIIDGPPCTLY